MSKYLGLTATVGSDGSVIIPQSMLDGSGIKPGGDVEVFAQQGVVFIRSIDAACDLCGTYGKVTQVGNKQLCDNCISMLQTNLPQQA